MNVKFFSASFLLGLIPALLNSNCAVADSLDQYFYRLNQPQVPFNGICYSSFHNLERVRSGVYGLQPPCITTTDTPSSQQAPSTPSTVTQPPNVGNQISSPASPPQNINPTPSPTNTGVNPLQTNPPSAYKRLTGGKSNN